MQQFDYQKYLKNNRLLKENINEATLKDLIKPLVAKLESMGYEVDSDPTPGFQTLEAYKTYPDESILRMYLTPSDKEVDQRQNSDDNRGLSDYTTLDVSFTYWPIQVTKKFFGLYKSKQRVMQDLPDEAGRNIDLGIGMFDIPVEDSVNRIISLLKKAEQKVSGGTPTRQMTGDPDTDFLGEAKEKEKDIEVDIDSAEQITLKGKELDSDKLGTNKKYRDLILKAPDKAFMYKGKPASITAVDLNDGSVDEPKIYLTIINESKINEAFAANSKLANALNLLKKNADSINDDTPEIAAALEAIKASGLTSQDVFTFASLFPRDSFKVDDIRTGKLEAQVNRVYFDGSDMLNKAKALRLFLLAFDNYHYGDKNWYKGY